MGRRTEGRPPTADYAVYTHELSREELMVMLNGIQDHRINAAKRHLQSLRAKRNKGENK